MRPAERPISALRPSAADDDEDVVAPVAPVAPGAFPATLGGFGDFFGFS